jgi:hypothetical protein
VTGILTIVLIGFLLMPAMALLSIVPFVHGAYAAYRVTQGTASTATRFIADMIERR